MIRIKQFFENKILTVFLSLVLSLTVVACGDNSDNDAEAFKVYYVNSQETGIVASKYDIASDTSDVDAVVSELIGVLESKPDNVKYEEPLSEEYGYENYSIQDKLLTLYFNNRYNELGRTIEILDRAAIVRTLTQLDFVDYVNFQVDGNPLTDHYGNVIGNMSADTFIYNVGNEINTYEKIELKLYFANETGDKLVPVYRSVVYNSNISMERLAVEQVISGPNNNIAYPTVNKDCKVNSVNVKDGVCYVDFDSAFLTQPNSVNAEVALYSIVNSIVEFSDVNKVVLSVNGELSFTFMDYVIAGSYERNLDLVE